ncbi:hypothetical protein HBA54_22630 [Pelagibius litoralis]|uniref:Uncharacterized protein n=1 Tax=Pelagibius litoralis TaxID=374515 RepID=A0A967F1G2_9PROT|nr:hypothetical protein [Pelagibius litoralis]NIA71396.1 hypothetical protein [Pelagibius litoralis]
MAKPTIKADKSIESELGNSGNIDQIREILFGAAQRDQESRNTRLENLIERKSTEAAQRLEKAQATFDRKMDKLSTDLNARLDQLIQKLGQVESTAREEIAAGGRELTEMINGLDDRLSRDIQEQGERFERDLEAVRDELANAVDRLDRDKAGNLNLGDQLIEVGMRLKGDPTLSKIEKSLSGLLNGQPDEKA